MIGGVKMRKLLENPSYMTIEEIEEKFAGKWVLATNCVYSEYNQVIGGIPVAVADTVFEGHRDGFYDKFRDPKYAPRTDKDFDYDNIPQITSFFGPIELVGEE